MISRSQQPIRETLPVPVVPPMKPPEPSAIRSRPPIQEEKTGTYRNLRFQHRSEGSESQATSPLAPTSTPTTAEVERLSTWENLDNPAVGAGGSAGDAGDAAQDPTGTAPGKSPSVSEPRLRVGPEAAEAPASIRPITSARRCRVLLAVASEAVTEAYLPVLRALQAAVVQVRDGAALKQALHERGAFDLVLTDSGLPGNTGLGILAGMRLAGKKPPFVIVQSIHQQLLRVVVGGGERGALSTRVVNDLALVELAEQLTGCHEAPASSRRAQGSL